jgi:hypothetical protein
MIALALLLAAIACWRWSFHTTDKLVATVRWCFAVFLLLQAAVCGLAVWVG